MSAYTVGFFPQSLSQFTKDLEFWDWWQTYIICIYDVSNSFYEVKISLRQKVWDLTNFDQFRALEWYKTPGLLAGFDPETMSNLHF